jgi:opacity protein-like surface antigen
MSASLLFAIGAACLMVWPSAMAAATPGDGPQAGAPRLNFRFDKDIFGLPAAQAATEVGAPQKFSRLAIRLYGGFSRVAAGDLNDGADGFFELLALYGSLGLGTVTGRYSPVHAGYNFGADFIYQFSPSIGVGLGVGYLRNSSNSLMTLASTTANITLTGTPTLSAVPIRLGMFLTVPVAGKINLTADAGATCYAGLKFDATQRLEFAANDWESMSVSGSRTSFANLGFQGSLGFEYVFSGNMGFFVEALGRYARFKNFDTVTGLTETSGGSSDTTTGKLYIDTFTYPDGTYSAFTIESTPPVDNPPAETFREPKIDLSGFSLQAGIRIRF